MKLYLQGGASLFYGLVAAGIGYLIHGRHGAAFGYLVGFGVVLLVLSVRGGLKQGVSLHGHGFWLLVAVLLLVADLVRFAY